MIKAQFRQIGHIIRMCDDSLLKQVLYSELKLRKHKKEEQEKHFKDSLKQNLTSCNINIGNFEDTAKDRSKGRATIDKGCKHCEKAEMKN